MSAVNVQTRVRDSKDFSKDKEKDEDNIKSKKLKEDRKNDTARKKDESIKDYLIRTKVREIKDFESYWMFYYIDTLSISGVEVVQIYF